MASSHPDDLVYRNKLQVTSTIKIPLAELDFQFARSSGPGGQHVNKTNSKAQLFWNVAESDVIGRNLKLRFMEKYANQISSAGVLLVESQTHREQHLNKKVALQKLQKMIRSVARPPKRRKPTKPTKASERKRLKAKAEHAQKKKLRRPPKREDN
ncbi:MAG: aminoacyl-tRNA hydrolase [Planctomycetaceae bacterium]|nr:aminoacyl-tRNA hydrolase [Planctomycetaceae bacterium]